MQYLKYHSYSKDAYMFYKRIMVFGLQTHQKNGKKNKTFIFADNLGAPTARRQKQRSRLGQCIFLVP